MIIGLTGRVGSGKSHFQALLSHQCSNLSICDLDSLGHNLLTKPVIQEALVKQFGASIRQSDGTISRTALGQIVFSNSQALKQLNVIVHPALTSQATEWIKQHKNHHCLVVGALINTLNLSPYMDHIITIDADDDTIKQYNAEKFDRISPHQPSRQQYQQQADKVFYNYFNTQSEKNIVIYVQKLLQSKT